MTQKFKEFKLWEIADLFYGNKYDKNKMTHNNPKVNFVSRTAKNNGVTDVVDKTDQQPFEQGALTLAFGGSVGSCFLQTEPFYTGARTAGRSPCPGARKAPGLSPAFLSSFVKASFSV